MPEKPAVRKMQKRGSQFWIFRSFGRNIFSLL